MSEPKSFKPLAFHIQDSKKINQVKPFIVHSTSIYIHLEDLINYSSMENNEKITLIDFANMHDIPMSDINILLKNGITTIEELSTVGISYLKNLGLSDIQAILNVL
mgnify:FL=1